MPGISWEGALHTGFTCHPPVPSIEGSPDVFVEGDPVHREGDAWDFSTCGTSVQDGVTISGSGTVFANGQAVGRIGDDISNGAAIAEGKETVFAGG